MKNEMHLLNGDALLEQFPDTINGVRIVIRECLVDGPVHGEALPAFFAQRAQFIAEAYGHYMEADYFQKTVEELERLFQEIPGIAEVNLWFERDLFCQVNCWFAVYLLSRYEYQGPVFLVLPDTDLQFGFGGMDQKALIRAYGNRTKLNSMDLEALHDLWQAYQTDDLVHLKQVAYAFASTMPFLLPAVEALADWKKDNKPQELLRSIIDELGTSSFGPVFRAFSERAPIYGFGDLQVKSMLDDLMEVKQ